jgi:KaiC protein
MNPQTEPETEQPEFDPPPMPLPPGMSVSDILFAMSEEGPQVREPTGVPFLDEHTGGGFPYGSRTVLNGAPDAGKTAFLVMLAHVYAQAGVFVAYHAIDEEEPDVLSRLGQRAGFLRRDFEERDLDRLDLIREKIGPLPIRFYGPDETIEDVAIAASTFAREHGFTKLCYCGDSIQTLTCRKIREAEEATSRAQSTYDTVTANMRAFRSVCAKYRMIGIVTSEMNRAGYAFGDQSKQGMGASSGSGAIEYQAKFMATVTSVSGGDGLTKIRIDKNKYGPSGAEAYFKIDRRYMSLEFVEAPEERSSSELQRIETLDRLAIYQGAILKALAGESGLSWNKLSARVLADIGKCPRDTFNAALEAMRDKLTVEDGSRGSKLYSLTVRGAS